MTKSAEAPEKPIARIKTDVPREVVLPLEWPVEFDGQTYSEIRIRRLTGVEVQAFVETLESGVRSARPPMVECPDEVYAAMDDDDRFTLEEAAIDFLPRRFRNWAGGSIQSNTEESSHSSPAS